MVGKVGKLVVEVGSLVFLGGKEEEEGGMEVLMLLEMEEEMEGRMVEELVEEMVVEMEGGRPKEGTASLGAAVACCWRRKKRKNERERRSGGVYIKGKFKIITSLPFQLMRLASLVKRDPRPMK